MGVLWRSRGFLIFKTSIMTEHTGDNITIIGTISGTLLSVAVTIDHQDYLKTIVLAAVGAAVSFIVTVFLRWVWRKVFKQR